MKEIVLDSEKEGSVKTISVFDTGLKSVRFRITESFDDDYGNVSNETSLLFTFDELDEIVEVLTAIRDELIIKRRMEADRERIAEWNRRINNEN